MSKARRSTEEEFFDLFADWKPDDQKSALRVMSEIHRQAARLAKRKPTTPEVPEVPAQQPAVAIGEVQRENA